MKLGFCGLGLMGAPMVERLLAAGHEVQVWNRSVEKTRPLAGLPVRIALNGSTSVPAQLEA